MTLAMSRPRPDHILSSLTSSPQSFSLTPHMLDMKGLDRAGDRHQGASDVLIVLARRPAHVSRVKSFDCDASELATKLIYIVLDLNGELQ